MAEPIRCPNCRHELSCSYYKGSRVVGCEGCGLRGPKSDRCDDDVHVPLALFTQHCTHSAEAEAFRTQKREFCETIDELREQLSQQHPESWARITRRLTDERDKLTGQLYDCRQLLDTAIDAWECGEWNSLLNMQQLHLTREWCEKAKEANSDP